MSLFQCENCGCAENTALSEQGFSFVEIYDWTKMTDLKGKRLCCVCGPTFFTDGTPTSAGNWHEQFDRVFLPKEKFKTNKDGNLEHIESGSTDFRQFKINGEI